MLWRGKAVLSLKKSSYLMQKEFHSSPKFSLQLAGPAYRIAVYFVNMCCLFYELFTFVTYVKLCDDTVPVTNSISKEFTLTALSQVRLHSCPP